MYHPAAALRTPAIERESYADIAGVPMALLDSRRRRQAAVQPVSATIPPESVAPEGVGLGAVEPGSATVDVIGVETVEAREELDVALDAPVLTTGDAAEPQLTLF